MKAPFSPLDALSHIRLRSGMYIGRLGDGSHPDDGIYVMLKEVIDNSIDEFIMHNGEEDCDRAQREERDSLGPRLGTGDPFGQSDRVCQPDQYRREVQR